MCKSVLLFAFFLFISGVIDGWCLVAANAENGGPFGEGTLWLFRFARESVALQAALLPSFSKKICCTWGHGGDHGCIKKVLIRKRRMPKTDRPCRRTNTLFARFISHQPAVLFSQNKPATTNQPAVLFSQNKPAPAISHQPTEQALRPAVS
jgi:hypothetical protein